MCLGTFVSYKSYITKLMDWRWKGNLEECEIKSGYILNAGGRCLRNIYGTKSLPTKVQASKSDRKSPCGYIKLQRKFWSDRELWRGGTEAVEGKTEQIKEKCGEELEIIREEIKCLKKNRNNKNSGDVDAGSPAEKGF